MVFHCMFCIGVSYNANNASSILLHFRHSNGVHITNLWLCADIFTSLRLQLWKMQKHEQADTFSAHRAQKLFVHVNVNTLLHRVFAGCMATDCSR